MAKANLAHFANAKGERKKSRKSKLLGMERGKEKNENKKTRNSVLKNKKKAKAIFQEGMTLSGNGP